MDYVITISAHFSVIYYAKEDFAHIVLFLICSWLSFFFFFSKVAERSVLSLSWLSTFFILKFFFFPPAAVSVGSKVNVFRLNRPVTCAGRVTNAANQLIHLSYTPYASYRQGWMKGVVWKLFGGGRQVASLSPRIRQLPRQDARASLSETILFFSFLVFLANQLQPSPIEFRRWTSSFLFV